MWLVWIRCQKEVELNHPGLIQGYGCRKKETHRDLKVDIYGRSQITVVWLNAVADRSLVTVDGTIHSSGSMFVIAATMTYLLVPSQKDVDFL